MNFHIRFIHSFFGLGFGAERNHLCDDTCQYSWWALHCKVFIGPIIIYWTLPLCRPKKKKPHP